MQKIERVKKKIITYFTREYNASVALNSLSETFLEDKTSLLVGLQFFDAAANYLLLSETDLMAFKPEEAKEITEAKKSPFDNLLLIFYVTREGSVSFKLINGMGSRLFELSKQFTISLN